MIYSKEITTEASTPKSSLKRTVIKVTKGIVYKVEFYFPYGSEGKMGVAVLDGLFQVWPSNVGAFFTGSDINISFEDLYMKSAAPFEFQCYTYNTDDIFDHIVAVRIGLVSNEIYMARFLPNKTYEYFTKLLEDLETEKEIKKKKQRRTLGQTVFRLLRKEQKKEGDES